MKQAIGMTIVAASALTIWAGVTNAGGKKKDGTPIPTLRDQVAHVLSAGAPIKVKKGA